MPVRTYASMPSHQPLLGGLGEGDEFGQVGVVGDVGEEAVAGGGDRGAVGASIIHVRAPA